jgi:uncharacterized RDD family membrane protein YckC
MTARTDDAISSKPPAVARESYQGHYAGFASRFLSFVVDMIVITAIFLIVLAAIWFSAKILTGTSVAFNHGSIWVLVGYVIWAFIYFARSWGANGRTAGMALFGVQVVRDDGGDVSERKAALRTLVFPLSFVFLGLGFLGIVLGDRRRALHDVLARTTVIYSWDARAARLRYLSRS